MLSLECKATGHIIEPLACTTGEAVLFEPELLSSKLLPISVSHTLYTTTRLLYMYAH